MSDAEALTLADFGFPDEEAVERAEDSWFVERQAEKTKPAARNAEPKSDLEVPAPTSATSGEESGAGVGYTAFRAANPNPDGKKKKGRPVGWRKGLHMKPKAKAFDVAPLASSGPSKSLQTKNEEADEIKVEPPRVPALDAPLAPHLEIQKADAKLSSESPAPASTGYAAFRLANPGAKKLGRPVGWKMGAHAKRKRIEKQKQRKKSVVEQTGLNEASNIFPSIETIGQEEKGNFSFFHQQDGEVSMQLDQRPALGEFSLQINSPIYENVDEKHEAMEVDEDSDLSDSFWEGVLAAAGTSTPTTDLTSPNIIIRPELSTERYDKSARRDSAFDSTRSVPSSTLQDLNEADEMSEEYESGSSDVSHFSA